MSFGTVLGGAGLGLSVMGQLLKGFQASRIGDYNADVAIANSRAEAFALQREAEQRERLADALDDELAFIEDVRGFESERLDEDLEREEGRIISRIAKSGVAFEGSPQAILEETARQGSMEQMALTFRADQQKRQVRERQRQLRFGADTARFQARQRLRIGQQEAESARFVGESQRTGAIIGAATDVLTTVPGMI